MSVRQQGHELYVWHHLEMDPVRRGAASRIAAYLAALVPWLAYITAMAIADRWVDFRSVTLAFVIRSTPFTLVVIALPSLGVIAAARTVVARRAATVIMTAVSVYAGIAVIATDDGQAGLAVLWVPIVALPLAVILLIGGGIVEAWQDHDWPNLRSHLLASAIVVGGIAGLSSITAFSKITNTTEGDHPVPVAVAVFGTVATYFFLVARARIRHRMPTPVR